MGVPGLEDEEYPPETKNLVLFEEFTINFASNFGLSFNNNKACSTSNFYRYPTSKSYVHA